LVTGQSPVRRMNMKKSIVKVVILTAALLTAAVLGSQKAEALWPVCPPFCSNLK
jgi:hypothetical protein